MPSLHAPNPESKAAVAGRLLHRMLKAFPFVCFTLALVTDIIYWRTSYLTWMEFSAWLLLAGIAFGVLAALFGVIGFFLRPRARPMTSVWPYAAGSLIVLVLAFVNNLVHAGDGWTAVVPYGLILSALTVLVMLITAWLGATLVRPYDVGVRNHE
jgi:uncharacterized membrane protein